MAKSNKPQSKIAALITYILVVLALLVGLILPLGTKTLASGINFKQMPVLQLFGALYNLGVLKQLPSFGAALSTAYSYRVAVAGFAIDLGAIMLWLYAVVTLLALIMLIPICVSKKKSPMGYKMAVSTEVIVLVVLIVMFMMHLAKITIDWNWNLSLIIPLGVTLLVLMLQSMIYLKGSGVIKSIVFILSALSAFVVVYEVAAIIPALATPLKNLIKLMKGARPFETTSGLYALGGAYFNGSILLSLLTGDISALMPAGADGVPHIDYLVAHIFAIVVLAFVFINLLIDLIYIGKKTKKHMLVSSLVLYLIEIIFTVALAVVVFWVYGNIGLFLYILLLLALIQFIIAAIRLSIAPKKQKYVEPVEQERSAFDDFEKYDEPVVNQPEPRVEPKQEPQQEVVEEEIEEYVPAEPTQSKAVRKEMRRRNEAQPVYENTTPNYEVKEEFFVPVQEAPAPAPAPAEPVVETKNVIYTVNTIYNGPTDEFIRKLTNEEKVEFARVFLERSNDKLARIPEYVVGGNNKRFFSSIFIYFAHVRDHVSDGLMDKLYNEVSARN